MDLSSILIGVVLGALLTRIFSNLANDIYNYAKNKLISRFGKSKLTDSDLKKDTLTIYEEIMKFLKERQNNEPQSDFNNWKESTNNLLKYSRETMNLYDENFGAKVSTIRQEYLTRKIKSKRLEMFYEHPTNPLGIREVGYGLAELAGKLNVS